MSNKYTLKAQYNYKGNLWKPGKIVDSKDFDISVLIRDGAILEPFTGETDYPVEAAASRALRGQAPTAENGTGSAFIDANDSVPVFPTVDHLKASSVALKDGQTVYVKSIDRFFTWHLGFAGSADGLRSFADDGETGYFLHLPIASKEWIEKTTWYISALGDDENPGTNALPIATFKEWLTRTKGYYKDGTVINLVPDPDGTNSWDNISGILQGSVDNVDAILTIKGELRLIASSTKTGVTIADSDIATALQSKITKAATNFSAYVGKIAKAGSVMAYVTDDGTNECLLSYWSDLTGVVDATPTAETSVSFYDVTELAQVRLQVNNNHSKVVLQYMNIAQAKLNNTKMLWCKADSVLPVGDCSIVASNVTALTNETTICAINISNSIFTEIETRNSKLYCEGYCFFFGNLNNNNGQVELVGDNWVITTGNFYNGRNNSFCEASNSFLAGTCYWVFNLMTNSHCSVPMTTPQLTGTNADFALDGATSHIPIFAGGETDVPVAVSCKTWAELTGSPFNQYCRSQKGSSVVNMT